MKDYLNRDVVPGAIVLVAGRNIMLASIVTSMSAKTASVARHGRVAYNNLIVVDREFLASNRTVIDSIDELIEECRDQIDYTLPKITPPANTTRYVIAIGYDDKAKRLAALIHECSDKSYSSIRAAETHMRKVFTAGGYQGVYPYNTTWSSRWQTVSSSGSGSGRTHKMREMYDVDTVPMASLKMLGLEGHIGRIIPIDEFKTLIETPIDGLGAMINKLT